MDSETGSFPSHLGLWLPPSSKFYKEKLIIIFCLHKTSKFDNIVDSGCIQIWRFAARDEEFLRKLGRGAFSLVFKGVLPDTTETAMKMHEGLWQGEKQVQTEVSIICMI